MALLALMINENIILYTTVSSTPTSMPSVESTAERDLLTVFAVDSHTF